MKNREQLVQEHNLIPVGLHKVDGTELLWRSRSDAGIGALSDERFLDSYSRVTRNGFFTDHSRIREDGETGFAERYGGVGIGCNGGGARVANFAGAQVKGVGANPLAGRDAPRSHSYGGLDLQSAAKEIVYSTLLNQISPVGAQRIHGLILLDRQSGEHNARKSCSVLLVREPGVRPAHFLPCTDFRPKPEFKAVLRSDYSRIRSIYTSIPASGGVSEFYIFVQDFLDRAADQLSYFRMAKISHNALVPSNFLVDGRVMDTSLCSFVNAGHNYGQVTSYFDEPNVPLMVVGEMFHLVRKFTFTKIDPQHFGQLYVEKFGQYSNLNTGFTFGIGRGLATRFSATIEWRKVSARLQSIMVMGRGEKSHKLPTVDEADIASDMLAACLFSLVNGQPVQKGGKFIAGLADDLRALIDKLYPAFEEQFRSKAAFLDAFAIQTLKRAYLSSFFFITYIGKAIDDAGDAGDVGKVLDIVRAAELVSGWIYEEVADRKCTLFAGAEWRILFDSASSTFEMQMAGAPVEHIGDAASFNEFVSRHATAFQVHGFDFAPFLTAIGAFFSKNAADSFRGIKNVFS
jgi:hypothetical protein